MSTRSAFAVAAATIGALAAVPGTPLHRLAGGDGDGRDPRFDVPLDARPLRNVCESNPSTYFVDAATETPLAQGNAKAAGQLYVACSLPVQDAARAELTVRLRGDRFQVLRRDE